MPSLLHPPLPAPQARQRWHQLYGSARSLAIDGQVAIKPAGIATPQRGSTMTAVEEKFGAPANKSSAVGNPPITKWFYPNFVVVFEHDKVLHAVVVAG